MESAVEPLEELASLRAMLAASQAKTAAAEAENARLIQEHTRLDAHSAELAGMVARVESQNERYEHIIAQLRRLQFGKWSEQLDKDQLQLAFEDLVQGLGEIEQEEEKADPELKAHRSTERREKRLSLPDHLPQIEVVMEPEAGACPCCGGGLAQDRRGCLKATARRRSAPHPTSTHEPKPLSQRAALSRRPV